MGCGSSKTTASSPSFQKPKDNNLVPKNRKSSQIKLPETNSLTKSPREMQPNNNGISAKQTIQNGNKMPTNTTKEISRKTLKTGVEANGTKSPSSGIAFEVKLDNNSHNKALKRPPKLQKLESVPLLTVEMLAKKQAIADKNRQNEIQRKLAKTSKRKKQLLEAREMDQAHEKQQLQIEEKMNAQNQKRARVQAEIIAKQKRREQRAKKVRARAERIREGDDVVNYDVDPDETYNADEEDESWDLERSPDQQSNNSSHKGGRTRVETEETKSSNSNEDNNQDSRSVYDFFEN